MAAPASVDEFLDLLRKSGVIDEKRLDAYLQKARARLPSDPTQAAEVLLRDGFLTQFQKENILAGRWRRFFIGKYKVLERLGSGGMGQVYLCEHTLMRRRVAVKVLPTAKAKDSSALDRFYREARAVAALTHPNIVHAYDIDKNEDLHFLVMEYVDGANLQDIVKRSGPLDVLRACHYVRQSALALQHAHEAGLVHRDVKPGNILVDRGGVVKLLDLGLARFFHDEDDLLTQKYDENVLGTADYLSPEQALDSHTADIRADIYSLGATFYFLLTGHPPFESANVAQKLMMHQMREPPPIQDYRKDVPADIVAIVQKMMAKAPDNRYAVPGELADVLLPFTETAIEPPSVSEMPRLSPAATGNAPPSLDGGEMAQSKNHAPLSTPRPIPSTGSGSARKSSAAVAIAPVVQPAAVKASKSGAVEVASWEQIATDTADPSARADTRPQSGRHSSRAKRAPRKTLGMVVVVLALLTTVVIVLGSTAGLLIWYFFPRPAPPAPPVATGPPKLEVSRDPSRKGPFVHNTIQHAIRYARAGSIIELLDSEYEESIVIDPTRGATNITIQAAPDKEIVWRPVRSLKPDPNQPIIKLSKAFDFRLKGKGITLDGTTDAKFRPKHLMLINFDCSGMLIEDLQFRNLGANAILMMNCAGKKDDPIKLVGLKTITAKTEKPLPTTAIFFDADPRVVPPRNEHIVIENCIFQGLDPAKAIQFKNDKVLDKKSVRW